ncbi:hypothetical protein MSAN_00350500 [Mycena sanguinolenta]|uniref:Uncharacterized protein n=1 Tax=Mycena sanguinolenta TaxID=230812 RepID=A0A8H6ZD12_9AGAR|nr:hypothetical protein MSAN_00350500 [Mycena sanguinolenta]
MVELLLELQMEIFELSALSCPVAIPKFMLVAWWVNKWVERFLYRTIVFAEPIKPYRAFRPEILLRAIRSKPASFFRDSVRNLNFSADFDISEEDAKDIISACSGVVNLHLAHRQILSNSFMDVLPPVKRLYVAMEKLFHPSAVDFTHSSFSQLTHLEVRDWLSPENANQWAKLAALPELTHLSFSDCRQIFPVFRRILDTSKSLQIFVLLTSGHHLDIYRASRHGEEKLLTQDPRFVVMASIYYQWDWQMGVHSGQDYWARAERFVAERRTGLVHEWFMGTVEIFNRNSTEGLLHFLEPYSDSYKRDIPGSPRARGICGGVFKMV